ncbi:MAG: DUF296 domain-containing protein [Desulfobacterota bacterium]|nr:DUF296 domain-containing protein [Thermodesulfobacteriota bacterium]MDW8002199.1 DNA-binding protein [Deltaproteobacteria bacterium]
MDAVYTLERLHMGSLRKGEDLVQGLTQFVQTKGIRMGILWAIGALESARLAYYDQKKREYVQISIEDGVEILSMFGNISEKDGRPFIHAHIVVGDKDRVFGGHVQEGCRVFALEYLILELSGPILARSFDHETGLFLW